MSSNGPDQEDYSDKPEGRKRRWVIFRSVGGALLSLLLVGGFLGALLALFHPETPLPPEWNPTVPLSVTAPITPLTSSKLRLALSDPEQCLAALASAAQFDPMDPFEATENCHIRNRVSLSAIGVTRIDRVETSCATALRMTMWERHGVQPAAQEYLGSSATVLRQVGSYNCRPIRTSQGASSRWSTHATADAIDITGFDFADGRRIRLINDWNDGTEEAQFLRAVRDSACTWFATTLGPDYNRLHADHFHLQARGWGTCR